MIFQGRLDLVKTTVDKGLTDFFTGKRQKANKISPHCVALVDQIASLTMRGGKRTRAFLCWLGAQTTKETKISKELQYAMMALELFQSFALIHDDIMDEDTIRRGGPTVHEHFKVESLKFKVKNAKHFGTSLAILAGDLALVWADELMKKGKRQTPACRRGRENGKREDIYQKMKEEVIYGQSLDVLAGIGMPSADRPTINRYKTAWYSVIRPLQIGAAVGGANEESLKSFVPYGLAVGEGYQLRDDFLDGDIKKREFDRRATKLKKRAFQAIKKIKMSESATILFTDFVHFIHDRSV